MSMQSWAVLVGSNFNGTINKSYSVVSIAGSGENIGGLVGENNDESIIVSSYWDIEKSGQSISAGGEGRTTLETTFPLWGKYIHRMGF